LQKICVVFGLALLLTACAAPPRYEYTKEGASDHEKINSISECQYQIRLNKTPPAEINELNHLCMQGKGFRIRRVN
jgi:hypothetical protein